MDQDSKATHSNGWQGGNFTVGNHKIWTARKNRQNILQADDNSNRRIVTNLNLTNKINEAGVAYFNYQIKYHRSPF